METKETQITLSNVTTVATFEPNKVSDLLKQIRESALSEVFDCDTAKGRAECKSHAHKVSKSKVHLVNLAKDSVAEAQAIVKGVTKERMRIEHDLDELRDEVKKPAVDWEQKEQARKDGHRAAILDIKSFGGLGNLSDTDIESVEWSIKKLEEVDVSKLEEFEEEGSRALSEAVADLNRRKDQFKQAAELAAELQRLKQVEADAKAAEVKRLAEEQARKDEAARVEAEKANAVRVKELAEEADKRREEEEEDRRKAEDKRIEQAKADAAKAERERIEKEQAETAHKQKVIADALEAKRVADELKEAKRKADETHRKQVRTEARQDMDSATKGCPPEKLITILGNAIERGEVRHMTLNF